MSQPLWVLVIVVGLVGVVYVAAWALAKIQDILDDRQRARHE